VFSVRGQSCSVTEGDDWSGLLRKADFLLSWSALQLSDNGNDIYS
jgi:hypothetical protein